MTQDRQIKKVKTYRALKVVFYCLGLPLFFVAVFLSAIKFIGNDPFTGTSAFTTQLGFFKDWEILFTSPALYGIWIAFAIWAVIAIVHIVLSKTVKNRRIRMFSMMAVTLVVMFGTMLGMDSALGAKVGEFAKNAPEGVTVADYKTQLSYYRTISSNRHSKNMTENLIEQVELLEQVYNVGMEGIDKTGNAGNIANKPATYYNIIDDEGNTGVDISFRTDENTGIPRLDYNPAGNTFVGDGEVTKEVEGKQVVRLAPDGNDALVINGKTYSHYFYVERKSTAGESVFTWYIKDMMPVGWEWKGESKVNVTDGRYGKGLYNESGMLADGWVFSLENVLYILEDYYSAKEAIENGSKEFYGNYNSMFTDAMSRRDAYYRGEIADNDGNYVDPWVSALYEQEVRNAERFSLTRGEIDQLIAKVGALLGDNALFDYLFVNIDTIIGDLDSIGDLVTGALGGTLGGILKQLNEGMSLSKFGLTGDTMNTVVDIVKTLINKPNLEVEDLYLTLAYKAKDCFGREQDHLYVGLVRGVGSWTYADGSKVPVVKRNGKWYYEGADGKEFVTVDRDGKKYDENDKEVVYKVGVGTNPEEDILLDIDFDDRLIDEETGKFAFDFDTLSEFLNTGLNNMLKKYNININEGIIKTVLGLFLKDIDVNGETYKGLVISGISIPLIDSTGKINLDINGIITNLVSTMYTYQSSVIKPVWEFYAVPYYEGGVLIEDEEYLAQKNYEKYDRALFMAKVQGGMIGSVLIGDTLGTGAYDASFGLQDLASVRQLLSDLSYQPVYFPLYAVRDMLAFLTGIVIFFYFLSFIMAQKEEDCASGKLTGKSGKGKKDGEAKIIAEFDAFELENAENGGITDTSDASSSDGFEEAEPIKEKKGLFGKKKKKEDDFVDFAEEETFAEDDFDESIAEKKGLFGRKNRKSEVEPAEDASEQTDVFVEDEPVKEKKSLFGKRKNKEEIEEIDEFAAVEDSFVQDEPVKEKKGLFGRKKKNDDLVEDETGEDTALPVNENSDKEVR